MISNPFADQTGNGYNAFPVEDPQFTGALQAVVIESPDLNDLCLLSGGHLELLDDTAFEVGIEPPTPQSFEFVGGATFNFINGDPFEMIQ